VRRAQWNSGNLSVNSHSSVPPTGRRSAASSSPAFGRESIGPDAPDAFTETKNVFNLYREA